MVNVAPSAPVRIVVTARPPWAGWPGPGPRGVGGWWGTGPRRPRVPPSAPPSRPGGGGRGPARGGGGGPGPPRPVRGENPPLTPPPADSRGAGAVHGAAPNRTTAGTPAARSL